MRSDHDDDDDPRTDIDVRIDAGELVDVIEGARENHVTLPAPALPSVDLEPSTLQVKNGVRGLLGLHAREAFPSAHDDATVELLSSRPPAEEEEKTTLNVASRLRMALAAPGSDPPLEETKPKRSLAPIVPLHKPAFPMELPPTMPAEFPPSAHVRLEGGPVEPRGPKGTVKIVSTSQGTIVVSPVAPPAVLVEPGPRRRRRGWMVFALLLAVLLVVGFVERSAVADFVRATTAAMHR